MEETVSSGRNLKVLLFKRKITYKIDRKCHIKLSFQGPFDVRAKCSKRMPTFQTASTGVDHALTGHQCVVDARGSRSKRRHSF